MSARMRLACIGAQRRVNCSLVRLLLVALYVAAMFIILVHFLKSSSSGDIFGGGALVGGGGLDPAKYLIVGEGKEFRKEFGGVQVGNMPASVQRFESGFVDGLGNKGRGVNLSDEEKAAVDEIQKKWAFNKVVSDKIPLWRSVPDSRLSECRSLQYSANLPTSSVIIIFNNEALSALLRTVWSVLDRTPSHLLKEVILVDDSSNNTEITEVLPLYIKHRLSSKVGLVKTPSQLGLIRARLEGANVATGDILVFLDSHCEATQGWLEPMAQRIMEDPTVVQIPRIESIDSNSLAYYGGGGADVSVGGFTWSGHFTWESQPEHIRKTRKVTDPAKTATMAGGLFAVQREFFFSVGGYDEGMVGWGGENLEMSFRVWRCGGSMEIHPCSHVGHIFRPFHPYFIPHDSHGINTARMAEVWMDDFKRFFYMHRKDLIGADIGDLKDRFAIIDRLKCKSFRWFLETVYPHKYIFDEQSLAWGRVKNINMDKSICIDHLQRDTAHKLGSYVLGEYPCHPVLGDSQYFALSQQGDLRNEYMCAEVSSSIPLVTKSQVRMTGCRETGSQAWEINRLGQIRHKKSNLCVDGGTSGAGDELSMLECDDRPSQVWVFEFYAKGSEHLKPPVP